MSEYLPSKDNIPESIRSLNWRPISEAVLASTGAEVLIAVPIFDDGRVSQETFNEYLLETASLDRLDDCPARFDTGAEGYDVDEADWFVVIRLAEQVE